MNIETTFTWERSPGEEIELTIGGEYQPSQILNEHEGFVSGAISLDWIIDPTGVCECEKCQKLQSGKYISKLYFDASEIEAMEQSLIEVAHKTMSAQPKLRSIREMLDLPEFKPTKPFVI